MKPDFGRWNRHLAAVEAKKSEMCASGASVIDVANVEKEMHDDFSTETRVLLKKVKAI